MKRTYALVMAVLLLAGCLVGCSARKNQNVTNTPNTHVSPSVTPEGSNNVGTNHNDAYEGGGAGNGVVENNDHNTTTDHNNTTNTGNGTNHEDGVLDNVGNAAEDLINGAGNAADDLINGVENTVEGTNNARRVH